MWSVYSVLALASCLWTAEAAPPPQLLNSLQSGLSRSSSISFQPDAPIRWSSYNAPDPLFVVNVRNEQDISLTVKLCNLFNVPFLVQNGGVGWSSSFKMNNDGIIINMAALNTFTVSKNKKEATIGGGAKIKETIDSAFANGVQVVTGNCNCVGTLGAMLGGGYGNLIGLHGMGADQILSLRVVTADGSIKTVSPTCDSELFWGLRGAGPNLAVVVSATVRSYPVDSKGMMAWSSGLIYGEDKLEKVVQAVNDLKLKAETNIFLYYIGSPVDGKPVIYLTPFMYNGNEDAGKAFFKSLYDLEPFVASSQVLPYNEWNTGADFFCERDGARKPSYGAGFQTMNPATWRTVWNEFVKFQSLPGAGATSVVLERYSLGKSRTFAPDSSAFAHRGVEYQGFPIAWYQDRALDKQAEAFGSNIRNAFRATDGLPSNLTYINFAHGDEANEVVYGANLQRLKALKKRVDPKNRFNQWYNIKA